MNKFYNLLIACVAMVVGCVVLWSVYSCVSLFVLYASDVLIGTYLCQLNNALLGGIILFTLKMLLNNPS